MTTPASLADDIRAHIERHIGPIHQVFNDWEDQPFPISVQHVEPSEGRPIHTLITIGISAREMSVPEGSESPRSIELMITLPESWKIEADLTQQEQWPIRLLQSLARRAISTKGWIGWGDLIPNGEPPQPYAPSTKLCAALIVPSLLVPTDFYQLTVQGKNIAFFAVVPLYAEEWQLGINNGNKALIERIIDRDVNDVVVPNRKNVAKRRWLGLGR
jgi:hypothetical protein